MRPNMVRRSAGDHLRHETQIPDVETSSEAYAARFTGPVGQWMLDMQASLVVGMIRAARPGPLRVLEVGGGHGQLVEALRRAGHREVVQGSRLECLRRLRAAGSDAPPVIADLWRLPFPDRSFDLVLAIRLLAHVEAWRELLAEMARVARHLVLVDYPARGGVQAFGPALFGVKRHLEGDTRPYFQYSTPEIADAFRAVGFRLCGVRPEFAWPMALHRLARRPRLSALMERAAGALGITSRAGSPVLAIAERGHGDRSRS